MKATTARPRLALPPSTEVHFLKKEKKKPATPDLSGPLAMEALAEEAVGQDWLAAQEIRARMAVQQRLTEERVRAMLADLQTQLFLIYQGVMLRRQKAFDDVAKQWAKLMVG